MVKTPPQHQIIPLLENGDKLTRYEFERRYNAMPNLKKAELIEGIVYIMPASLQRHAQFKKSRINRGNCLSYACCFAF